MTKQLTPFGKWLNIKKLTMSQFAQLMGFDLNTVSKWSARSPLADGIRRPRYLYRKTIAAKFPDCPLSK